MTEPGVPAASRRALLGCAGAACAAALAGCATYNSGNGGIAGSSPPATPASPPGTTGPGGPAVLARTADVPVGGGTILASRKIVITQPKAGTFAAFTAVCTHLGCLVTSITGGTINCPCHGRNFSITNGSVINGPATTPLAPVSIKVHGTAIIQA
jgi:nitrite reductase/ring-hydroxylating ferredoxin subunit